jgi:hypothetical protein
MAWTGRWTLVAAVAKTESHWAGHVQIRSPHAVARAKKATPMTACPAACCFLPASLPRAPRAWTHPSPSRQNAADQAQFPYHGSRWRTTAAAASHLAEAMAAMANAAWARILLWASVAAPAARRASRRGLLGPIADGADSVPAEGLLEGQETCHSHWLPGTAGFDDCAACVVLRPARGKVLASDPVLPLGPKAGWQPHEPAHSHCSTRMRAAAFYDIGRPERRPALPSDDLGAPPRRPR